MGTENRNKQLRVLSIDFDYFQKVPSVNIIDDYPDGLDLGTELSTVVWASAYAYPKSRDAIMQVKADEAGIGKIKEIILGSQETCFDVLVAQSHKHIYDFIMENYKDGGYSSLRLVNVDMHHDVTNKNDKLDCGNWLGYICKEIKDHDVTWVANPVSEKAYGMCKELKNRVSFNLDDIAKEQFDLVFLCRSDNWLPPHLDKHFDDLYSFVLDTFWSARVDKQIMMPRNYAPAVAEISGAMKNISKPE